MSRFLFRSSSLAACLFLGFAGCNAPGARSGETPKLDYWNARGYDLMDILELDVSAGVGLLASAAVEPVKIGYGYYQSSKFGMMGRATGTWDECRNELFVGLHHLNCWHKRPCWGNGFLFTPEVIHRESAQRDPSDHSRLAFYEEWGWTTRWADHEKHWLDVTAEVHLFFVGIAVAFSPQETADFLLGLFMCDAISNDDYAPDPMGVADEGFLEEHARDD